jgi:putative LysE/RhtB family amino acid efflux pump
MSSAFAAGFGLGFLVAAQVGPIWLLCARSVLRGTAWIGIAIGAGAAIIDALYAALGVLGANALLEIDALRVTLGILGAGFLAYLGARTLWSAFRVRLGGEVADEVSTPRRAFMTSLAATASNPMTIASWAAIFTAASTADLVGSGFTASALVAGVAVGTFTWFLALSLVLSVARRRVGDRVLIAVDVVSGIALLGFAGLLAWRTASDA